MNVWIITGASRGLGAALAQKVLNHDNASQVFACARQPNSSTELHDLKCLYEDRVHLVELDVTSEESAQVCIFFVTYYSSSTIVETYFQWKDRWSADQA
jgi:NAD(P)-dependent dehydrogenase (short-subunit alcohol dehydrogenase family)